MEKGIPTYQEFCDFGFNCYGVPLDPIHDGNMSQYLGKIVEYIRNHPEIGFYLYACGGYTEDETMTEAQAALLWFCGQKNLPKNILDKKMIEPEEKTAMMRENMQLFARNSRWNYDKIYACEYSRRFKAKFLLFFTIFFEALTEKEWKCEVFPVKFDDRAMTLKNRLLEYTVRLAGEILAYFWPWFDRNVRKKKREQQIYALRAMRAKVRAEERAAQTSET